MGKTTASTARQPRRKQHSQVPAAAPAAVIRPRLFRRLQRVPLSRRLCLLLCRCGYRTAACDDGAAAAAAAAADPSPAARLGATNPAAAAAAAAAAALHAAGRPPAGTTSAAAAAGKAAPGGTLLHEPWRLHPAKLAGWQCEPSCRCYVALHTNRSRRSAKQPQAKLRQRGQLGAPASSRAGGERAQRRRQHACGSRATQARRSSDGCSSSYQEVNR